MGKITRAAAILILAVFMGGSWRGLPAQQPPASTDFDLIIRGGRILDGSGNPWFTADIGIRERRIAAIGPLVAQGRTAKRTIDATGHFVTPGFIDIHSHSEVDLHNEASQPPTFSLTTTVAVSNSRTRYHMRILRPVFHEHSRPAHHDIPLRRP